MEQTTNMLSGSINSQTSTGNPVTLHNQVIEELEAYSFELFVKTMDEGIRKAKTEAFRKRIPEILRKLKENTRGKVSAEKLVTSYLLFLEALAFQFSDYLSEGLKEADLSSASAIKGRMHCLLNYGAVKTQFRNCCNTLVKRGRISVAEKHIFCANLDKSVKGLAKAAQWCYAANTADEVFEALNRLDDAIILEWRE